MNVRLTTIRHRSRQRLKVAALFALLVLGGVGCSLSGDRPPPLAADVWRRTRDGWQEAYWLNAAIPDRAARFHPLYAALLQGMLAAMGLMANGPSLHHRPIR